MVHNWLSLSTNNTYLHHILIYSALHDNGTSPDDVTHVVGTHGHSDHIGNLSLFPGATFIVSYDICRGNRYFDNNLANGEAYSIAEGLRVIPTPGHTSNDVSVVVEATQLGTVVVAGMESELSICLANGG